MSDRPRIDQTELDDLMSRTNLSDLFGRYGVPSKGNSPIKWVTCCFHGENTPSLKIDDKRGQYHCFGCGASGNHIRFLMEYVGQKFHEAVETLGGTRLITKEERDQIEANRRKIEQEERQRQERTRSAVERIFDAGKPVAGTHVEAYLAARGLPVVSRWTFDLRFVPDLTYRGFVDEDAGEAVDLGKFPAMIAAIRDRHDKIIGLHRTYLDQSKPVKLSPPGDARRNKAKKVMGEQRGGMIRLSPPAPHLTMGEGIETSQAWFALGYGDEETAIAAAVSLGNMSGSSTGSSPHPKDDRKRVPNGDPDMDRPGLVLPTWVQSVTLLGDGDSDPYMTRARLLVAARRYHRSGRGVFIHMAPDGCDWNDVLVRDEEAAG